MHREGGAKAYTAPAGIKQARKIAYTQANHPAATVATNDFKDRTRHGWYGRSYHGSGAYAGAEHL